MILCKRKIYEKKIEEEDYQVKKKKKKREKGDA